jgi:simple sugar transport system permease protein
VYTFCGLAAGVAGLIISSNVKSADAINAGQLLELDAILAVTLGGTALTGGASRWPAPSSARSSSRH